MKESTIIKCYFRVKETFPQIIPNWTIRDIAEFALIDARNESIKSCKQAYEEILRRIVDDSMMSNEEFKEESNGIDLNYFLNHLI